MTSLTIAEHRERLPSKGVESYPRDGVLPTKYEVRFTNWPSFRRVYVEFEPAPTPAEQARFGTSDSVIGVFVPYVLVGREHARLSIEQADAIGYDTRKIHAAGR